MYTAQQVPGLAIIDPACHTPELACLNFLAAVSPLPVSYHLPALFGLDTLYELDHYAAPSGVLILGSAASVHDTFPWQEDLKLWLKPKLMLGIPCLGLCYGHQLIAHLFGGLVNYCHADRRKAKGLRTIYINECLPWAGAQQANVIVSHAEAVTSLPDCLKPAALSSELTVEALMHRELPIYGFQAHLEATSLFVKNNAIPLDTPIPSDGHTLIRQFMTHFFAQKHPL